MNIDAVMQDSRPVDLEEMLSARERRADRQRELLALGEGTVISFTLNIPGPRKNFPLAERAFAIGTSLATERLQDEGIPIFHQEKQALATGCEAYFRVGCNGIQVKKLMMDIEESHPLGRLFDIDVFDNINGPLRGNGLGRLERQCLICGNPVWQCARSRNHSADELVRCVAQLLKKYFDGKYADTVAKHATQALLYEVAVCPKPGLVDRINNGAHRDMNFFTFIDSAVVLTPYFRDMTLQGIAFQGSSSELLPHLRQPGRWAEKHMHIVTNGINTHKGAIFSLGIVCAGLGILYANSQLVTLDSIAKVCSEIAGKTTEELTVSPTNESTITHGEQAYAKFGLTGVRGEAAAGFPNARNYGYRIIKEMIDKHNCSFNDAGVIALLHLMAHVDDTNIVSRAGAPALKAIQKEVDAFLKQQPEKTACLNFAADLDQRFIEQNISPGGCADLLALAYFFYFIVNCEG